MPEVRWERMFPDQLESAFSQCPLAYFTYGLCEPHGPHNAVGLDSLKAHAIACCAAQTHGGIVAPPDYWHIHEIGGYALWSERAVGQPDRSWLTCMPPWQHFKNVLYQIRQADTLGFHAAILITGHYGPNWKDLKTMINLVQPHVGVRLYGLPDFEANTPGFANDGNSGGDHAGRVETSLLWATHPECVDITRLPDHNDDGPHFAMGKNARESNRRTGERMVEDEVKWLGEKATELLQAYASESQKPRLRTFAQTEALWTDVIVPEFKNFETMKNSWTDEQQLSEDSVWHANWQVPDIEI